MNEKEIGILVVDDELIVRESFAQWFREDGYRVDSAEDAIVTLRKLQEQRWNIILLDIKMPGMDGIELLQRIREANKNIAIIIITAYASVESAVKALKIGAYDYITKPINPDDLDLLIRKALKEQELDSASTSLKEGGDQRQRRRLSDVERYHIEQILQETGWDTGRSAQILDIDRTTLLHKVQKYGLRRPSQ